VPETLLRKADLLEGATTGLRWASDEPRREALWLAGAIFDQSPAEVLLSGETSATVDQARALDQAVLRRAAGEPLAHVVGTIGFRHLTLNCDARALIPRPETELLVDLVLERVTTGVAVDVGTGSGCLALSLAQEGAFERVLAIDRSAAAVALARENAAATNVQVDFIRGDLITMLRGGSVDALVANPPYLTREEYLCLDPAVRSWEPEEALVSGGDGLEATRSIVARGREILKPGGWMILEVDATRARAVADIMQQMDLTAVSVTRDLFERERFVEAQRRS